MIGAAKKKGLFKERGRRAKTAYFTHWMTGTAFPKNGLRPTRLTLKFAFVLCQEQTLRDGNRATGPCKQSEVL